MSVTFPGLMPSLGSFPKAAWEDCPTPHPWPSDTGKSPRGQGWGCGPAQDSRGFVGWGPRLLGWSCSGELGRPSESRKIGW